LEISHRAWETGDTLTLTEYNRPVFRVETFDPSSITDPAPLFATTAIPPTEAKPCPPPCPGMLTATRNGLMNVVITDESGNTMHRRTSGFENPHHGLTMQNVAPSRIEPPAPTRCFHPSLHPLCRKFQGPELIFTSR
jgi:hypothetical protein